MLKEMETQGLHSDLIDRQFNNSLSPHSTKSDKVARHVEVVGQWWVTLLSKRSMFYTRKKL